MKRFIAVLTFLMSVTVMAAAPNAPTNFSAQAHLDETKVTLSWTDNSNNETGFAIQRADNGNWGAVIATVAANQTTYTDNLSNNRSYNLYQYRVVAVNGSGSSAYTETDVWEPIPYGYFENFGASPSGVTFSYYETNTVSRNIWRNSLSVYSEAQIDESQLIYGVDRGVWWNEAFVYSLHLHNAWSSTYVTSPDYVYVPDYSQETLPTMGFQSTAQLQTTEGNSYNVTIVSDTSAWYPVFAELVIAGGTATYGADYTITNGNNQLIAFGPGETSKQIQLNILNDAITENNESISITLQSPIGCQIGTNSYWKNFVVIDVSAPDTTAPLVSFESPGEGAYTGSKRPQLSVEYFDGGSGVNVGSVVLKLDGSTVGGSANGTGVIYTPTVDLADGAHTLQVTVNDYSGNQRQQSWTFNVDTTDPTILVTTPTATIGDDFPLIGVMYEDLGAGIDLSLLQVFFNSTQVTPIYADQNLAFFYPSAALSNGTYDVALAIVDNVGNTSMPFWQFTIDTVNPHIRIYPVYGTFPVTWTATVWQNKVDVTDQYTLSWNGGTPFGTQTGDSFTLQAGPTAGSYPISIQAVLTSNPTVPALTSSASVRVGDGEETGGEAQPAEPVIAPVPTVVKFINPVKDSVVKDGVTFIGMKVDYSFEVEGAGERVFSAKEHVRLRPGTLKGIFVDTPPEIIGNPNPVVNPEGKPDFHMMELEGLVSVITAAVNLNKFDNNAENSYVAEQLITYFPSPNSPEEKVIHRSGFKITYELQKVDAETVEFHITKQPDRPTGRIDGFVARGAGAGGDRTVTYIFKKINDVWKKQ
jgi:hypothetical protein